MGVPFIQQLRVGAYVLGKRLGRVERYPLVLMLEPLFRCNLACPGCGKIDYEDRILNMRLSVEECLEAVDECGAPVVSIPGGEPLLHKGIQDIVGGIVARKKFVYLCTNALLMEKRLHLFTPSPYLTFSVHLDGLKEHHDRAVDQDGVFERAVSAIRAARDRGFRVNVNCTLFDQMTAEDAVAFFDFAIHELGVEGITISPGYAYERAPDQEHFLSGKRPNACSARSSGGARGASGGSATRFSSSTSSPATSSTGARRGAIRPATSSAGNAPVIFSPRATPVRSKS